MGDWADWSENNGILTSGEAATYDGVILRAGTGEFGTQREDHVWRQSFNAVVAARKPIGLYWFGGPNPVAEAEFFHNLVSFLRPNQVAGNFWVDPESGQKTPWVDQFRSAVILPFCGLYGNLDAFNTCFPEYMHFGLNWLAMPDGVVVPSGWAIPDHILRQNGQRAGVDINEWQPAQPYPGAW